MADRRTESCGVGHKGFQNTFIVLQAHTLSRWLTEKLKAVGLDTEVFSAHITSASSTNAAYGLGVPIDTIMKAPG